MTLVRSLYVVALVAAPAAVAEDGAVVDLVKYRQSTMKASGAHLKALMLATGKGLKVSQRQLQAHADAIVGTAEIIPELFPPGTGPAAAKDATDAKEEVWKDPTKFKAAADDFVTRARALKDAADKGDAEGLKKAAAAVGDSCDGCHKPFKARK